MENDQNRAAEPLEYLPGPKTLIVRDFPNGIFNPWARWITGLALAKNSSVAAVVVVVALWKSLENP